VAPEYGPSFKAGKRKEPGGGFPTLDYPGDHGHSPDFLIQAYCSKFKALLLFQKRKANFRLNFL
jgi:hypothetical protein